MRGSAISLTLVLAGATLAFAPARRAVATEAELTQQVPTAKVTQQIGLTEIAVEYECPAVQGRKVWGGVVPYDRPWMIGGAKGAKIKFTKEVRLGDRAVPAGTYWLAALPGKTGWTLMLNKGAEGGGPSLVYMPGADVARVRALPRSVPRRERLLFTFSDINDDGASLDLEWDSLRVSLPIQVGTPQKALASIGLDGTFRAFANAARYMLETTRDFDSGLKYVDQALALKDDWYCMWVKGALLAAKGDYRGGRDWAVKAREAAQQAGNGTLLAADLDRTIADWTHEGGGSRSEAEAQVLKKAGDEATLTSSVARSDGAPLTDPAPAYNSAPESAPPVATAPARKTTAEHEPARAPAGDPPLLHRARLRRR
jgi:hypothetical protein